MESLKSKVAYLQGLAQGLEIGQSTKEGKLLTGILDVLEEMTRQVGSISDRQTDLQDYVSALDDDLALVEDEVRPMEDEETLTELACPSCGQTLMFDSDPFDDDEEIEVICPSCGESLYEDGFEVDEASENLSYKNHPLSEDDVYHKE